jgi:hypothetical protein
MEKKEKSKPQPSKSGRVGHPEKQRLRKMQQQCRLDDVQQWYYSGVIKCQSKKNDGRVRHPPASARRVGIAASEGKPSPAFELPANV